MREEKWGDLMYQDTDKIIELFKNSQNILGGCELPEWNELPDIELYMDQVITIISKYLDAYHTASKLEKTITPSMINNYVKLKTIPAPIKKRYSKIHLAYLIIVCVLKQTLDMSTIQKLVPISLSEDDIKRVYDSFVRNQKKAFEYVSGSIESLAEPILNEGADEVVGDILMQVSASANFYKMITERLADIKLSDEEE